MSCPMLCPKPQSAPISVALMLLLPMVSGVRACAQPGPSLQFPSSSIRARLVQHRHLEGACKQNLQTTQTCIGSHTELSAVACVMYEPMSMAATNCMSEHPPLNDLGQTMCAGSLPPGQPKHSSLPL